MSERRLADLLAMWRIRAFEEKVGDLRAEGPIVGSVHLCLGQEAIPVGACGELEPHDALFATYRGHGWALARGVPAQPLFAELMGRAGGVNGGRGGSAYFTAAEYGFHGENSIVGAGAPIACGAALAGRFDGSNRAAVSVFGDGAMNQGAVHEAMNFAAAFSLPVVFVCENNRYSELTPIADMVRAPRLADRAAAYGMPGHRIDGNDAEAVRFHVRDALEVAREGGGPTLLECMTERLVGHYIGDAEDYRQAGEMERIRRREPIARLRAGLLADGVAAADVDAVEREARKEMESAAAAALEAPFADPATARKHLYA
ncbi:thiamine pyrophosphate-dependent dehydrogenase E1 component subunit alpha [Nonomuraea sp. NPDC046802]|uniref:thiamine pyrophosphate-dependent dehydrogenase E1 component subunit alpha n=1 Tax=Nonomuraea sp. NPDC046802 TaxID=3154919 RepID=UPI0033D47FFF